MKAVRVHELGPPSVMRVEEVPDPQVGVNQVLVRVRAIGVNPVDTYVRAGTHEHKPALPYTPGSDAAGEVDAVGQGVQRCTPGDRVYVGGRSLGTYAEAVVCDERHVHTLSAHLTFSQGAALHIPYVTAYRALFQVARAQPGETVLVHGATGGVGLAAVQIARMYGLRIVATGGTPKGRELVRAQGAHEVLDHRAPNYLNAVAACTGGRGPDVILEMLANVNLARDLEILAPRGRIVVVGARGPAEINPRVAMARDGAILGMSVWNASPDELSRVHAALDAGIDGGALRPVVGRELPLADAPKAHELVMAPGAYGKIVLIP